MRKRVISESLFSGLRILLSKFEGNPHPLPPPPLTKKIKFKTSSNAKIPVEFQPAKVLIHSQVKPIIQLQQKVHFPRKQNLTERFIAEMT